MATQLLQKTLSQVPEAVTPTYFQDLQDTQLYTSYMVLHRRR